MKILSRFEINKLILFRRESSTHQVIASGWFTRNTSWSFEANFPFCCVGVEMG